MNECVPQPLANLKEISYVGQTRANLYCKYLQSHCKQWHFLTHLPENLTSEPPSMCPCPACWPRGNTGLAVLHSV